MFSLMRDCVTLLGIVTTPRCVCHLRVQQTCVHVQSLERSSIRSAYISPPWYKLQKWHCFFHFFPTKIVTSTASTHLIQMKGSFSVLCEHSPKYFQQRSNPDVMILLNIRLRSPVFITGRKSVKVTKHIGNKTLKHDLIGEDFCTSQINFYR